MSRWVGGDWPGAFCNPGVKRLRYRLPLVESPPPLRKTANQNVVPLDSPAALLPPSQIASTAMNFNSRYSFRATIGCFVLASGLAASMAMRTGDKPAGQMLTYTTAWIETLDEGQKQKALLPYDSPERTNWNFIPLPTRKGLPMMEMTTPQKASALRTLRAAISEAGYEKSSKIMLLEGVLRQMEGAGKEGEVKDEVYARRNPEKYYLTVYGKPAATGTWGFSFEGHHLSLNFVCRDGQVVASTPQFMASNPAEIQSVVDGPLGKGTRVLRLEEEVAFELINGLSPELQARAIIAPEAPAEIRFVGQPHVTPTAAEGVKMSEMDEASQARVQRLIEVYAGTQPEPTAKQRLKEIKDAGPSTIHFAWSGATKPRLGHYYRIQGDTFLIEFVNTQPDAEGTPANHIHAVWRDVRGDFALPVK